MKQGIANLAVVCCLAVLWSCCGGSHLALYPNIIEQKKKISRATLVADIVLIEDLSGDFNKVDILENKRLGEMFLNALADEMHQKGYPIDKTVLTSIGLLMNPSRLYRVARTTEDERLDDDSLLLESPPFFVDEAFARDSSMKQTLGSVYNSLINYSKSEGEPNKIIPEAVRLGKEVGEGVLAVVLVGGYEVPVTRQIGEGRITPSLTQGKVAVQQTSQLSAMFYLVDTKNGEVIWSDQKYEKGGVIYRDKILDVIEDFMDDLP